MTINDLKYLDKRIRQIQDPLGTGFPVLKKVIDEIAEKYDLSTSRIIGQYAAWKWKK
jgi:hypothetical protein